MIIFKKVWLIPFIWFGAIFSGIATSRIGAQVWLEPTMTKVEVEGYFTQLAAHKMQVARLFVMWNFLENPDGKWNFQVYDWAFDAALKNKVEIVATLMPNFGPPHLGYYYKTQDGTIPKTQKELERSREYIRQVVNRYAKHPALKHWMLMNEPGQLPSPDSLAMERFRVYLKEKYKQIEVLNRGWLTGFSDFQQVTNSSAWAGGGFTWPTSYLDWQNFWANHLTWYLQEVALEIRKYDSQTPLHVNPHALMDIPHRYELKKWSKDFLQSLGASIHPVWHFNDLDRSQYPLGISFVCNMVGQAAGNKPYWVTELQGGHNIYTGSQPVNPTENEINAWLWTSIASGAEKTIFWTLNPRPKGGESGEWALLNYEYRPSKRLEAIAQIARKTEELNDFLKTAKPVFDQITLLISKETMFLQERNGKTEGILSRQVKAHFLSVWACYQALKMKGFHPKIQFIDDFDWQENRNKEELIFLCHATALSALQQESLLKFAERGNTVVLTGMVGMFDPEEKTNWLGDNLFKKIVGTAPLEAMTKANEGHGLALPFDTYWVKTRPITAIQRSAGEFENKVGKGSVIWFPALIDLAYFAQNDQMAYPNWLANIALPFKNEWSGSFTSTVIGSYVQFVSDGKKLLVLMHIPKAEGADGNRAAYTRKGLKEGDIFYGEPYSFDRESAAFHLSAGKTFVVLTDL